MSAALNGFPENPESSENVNTSISIMYSHSLM